jgi:hypothetical protein
MPPDQYPQHPRLKAEHVPNFKDELIFSEDIIVSLTEIKGFLVAMAIQGDCYIASIS